MGTALNIGEITGVLQKEKTVLGGNVARAREIFPPPLPSTWHGIEFIANNLFPRPSNLGIVYLE